MYRLILLCLFITVTKGENYTIEKVTNHPIDHAECPTWDPRKNTLYFVDIHNGRIFSYNYNNSEITSIQLKGEIAPVIQSKTNPDILFVGLNRSVVKVNVSQSTQFEVIFEFAKDKPSSRVNDGKADSKGRIWIGTMGYETKDGQLSPNDGSLYKLSKPNKISTMITPVNISNGLVWNKANTKFYFIDTPSRKIREYDYEETMGEISNPRTVFDLNQHKIVGFPDGMTSDKDDNLWIALYNGGAVINIDPKSGELLKTIPISNVKCVTSVMWGGPNLDILYVTTSRFSLSPKERKLQPEAGSVFAVRNLGTRGLPVFGADI